jgi:hypothetical protein
MDYLRLVRRPGKAKGQWCVQVVVPPELWGRVFSARGKSVKTLTYPLGIYGTKNDRAARRRARKRASEIVPRYLRQIADGRRAVESEANQQADADRQKADAERWEKIMPYMDWGLIDARVRQQIREDRRRLGLPSRPIFISEIGDRLGK